MLDCNALRTGLSTKAHICGRSKQLNASLLLRTRSQHASIESQRAKRRLGQQRHNGVVRAQSPQKEQAKPNVPAAAPGSGKVAKTGEPETAPEKESLPGGIFSLWNYYQGGPSEQLIITRQLPSEESGASDEEEGEEAGPTWGLLNLAAYTQPWRVPWGAKETIGGMALWGVSFLAVAFLAAPALFLKLGSKDMSDYTQLDWSYYAVAHQTLETIVSLGVVGFVVRKFRPLDSDLFRLSLSHPFRKGDGWLVWALLGIFTAPAIIAIVATGLTAISYEEATSGGKGTVDAVSQLISLNTPTYISLMTATAIQAPILEETVFRGFLLTSLTKWMPTGWAVLLSALCFGAAHFSARDFPQLTALGIVMGFAYVRSRNLLTPMVIHGTWNGVVLSILFALVKMGISLDDIPSW